MDPLSATASIITLIQVTVTLANISASLYTRLRDAPQALNGVRRQFSRISVILKEIQHLQGLRASPTIPQDVIDSLDQGLRDTENAISTFQAEFKDFPQSGRKAQLYWASVGHRRLKKQEECLRLCTEDLALLLNLLSL